MTAVDEQARNWSAAAAEYEADFIDPYAAGGRNPLLAELDALAGPRTAADLGCGVGPLLPACLPLGLQLSQPFDFISQRIALLVEFGSAGPELFQLVAARFGFGTGRLSVVCKSFQIGCKRAVGFFQAAVRVL